MLQFYPTTEITVPDDRQRTDFTESDMAALMEAVSTSGLLNPITCRMKDGKLTLVAGERRLRTIDNMHQLGVVVNFAGKALPSGTIPVINLGEIQELESATAEWYENAARASLSWTERVRATQLLDSLRKQQAEAAGKVYHISTTVEELYGEGSGKSHATAVKRQLIVAEHLEDPDVAAASSIKDAYKVIEKKVRREQNIQRAVAVEARDRGSLHKLFEGSCLTWMADEANAGLVDVILTDPPYGMGADSFGDSGKNTTLTHNYDDSLESWQELMDAFVPLTMAITKPDAHAYIWCDIERFADLKARMTAVGWKVHRTPLIQYKVNSGRVPWPDFGPRRCHEYILYAIRGHKVTNHIAPDVIESRFAPHEERLGHGAQKPVDTFLNLLARSARPDDLVFDGFAGSGTIFTAADVAKCRSVGCELTLEGIGQCKQRLDVLKIGR